MVDVPSPQEIGASARWLAQAIDPGQRLVRLVALDEEEYRAASFLDDRLLQRSPPAVVLPWAEATSALAERRDAGWIFHIGHVGSTLVSRLLGELPDVLAVREPRLLRDLATIAPAERAPFLPAIPRLVSRTFAPGQRAIVKATSFASEIAAELMPADAPALFLTATPAHYVATILAGENNPLELRSLAAMRARRMAERVPGLDLAGADDALLAAAAWACEATALEAAAAARPVALTHWADFDLMLGDMAAALGRCAALFGIAADPARIAAIASGPLARRYSKALDHDYDAKLRHDLLEDAARVHRGPIAAALAKLERAAHHSPLLAAALDRSRSRS